jgi:alkylation response protein AidB-like acyl-CoA dehydrogenase
VFAAPGLGQPDAVQTSIAADPPAVAGPPRHAYPESAGWPGARVAAAFADAVRSGRLDLPLPGAGRTRERWAALAELAEEDLSLARLAEGHADALAILAELGAGEPPAGSRWGVWAAQPPGPGLTARRSGSGWRLDGVKRYCSGAHSCTDALVTADAPDGNRLFAVATRDLSPVPGTWPATGMAASDTLDVGFTGIPGQPVGGPGSYTGRPGFAHGGVGVAACWYGGARGVGKTLLAAAAQRDIGPHALAHLGAVDIALGAARTALDVAAGEIDADPQDRAGPQNAGALRALRVRGLVEAVATEVMQRVGRALGAGPLSHDEAHSRRVADLTVYLRQHHAERDLAELGALVAGRGAWW